MADLATEIGLMVDDSEASPAKARFRRRHGWNAGKLNELETELVATYNGYGTIRDAALSAGISYDYARQILARTHVRAFLASGLPRTPEEQDAREKGLVIDRVAMERGLTCIFNDLTKPDSTRLRALETLAKMQGLLTDKVVHDIKADIRGTVKHVDLIERIKLVASPEVLVSASPGAVAAKDALLEGWLQ